MLTTILLISIGCYAAQLIFLRIGLAKAGRVPGSVDYIPTVSVIVAARNEEERIEDCLKSLTCLDYPAQRLEIMIVNDGSTDRTAEIVTSYLPLHPSLRVISAEPGTGNLRGKTNAVAQG